MSANFPSAKQRNTLGFGVLLKIHCSCYCCGDESKKTGGQVLAVATHTCTLPPTHTVISQAGRWRNGRNRFKHSTGDSMPFSLGPSDHALTAGSDSSHRRPDKDDNYPSPHFNNWFVTASRYVFDDVACRSPFVRSNSNEHLPSIRCTSILERLWGGRGRTSHWPSDIVYV